MEEFQQKLWCSHPQIRLFRIRIHRDEPVTSDVPLDEVEVALFKLAEVDQVMYRVTILEGACAELVCLARGKLERRH